jgi:hypothetical protein
MVPQCVDVSYAIDDVVAIGPHAVEGKVFDGAPLASKLTLRRHVHLNHRAFLDRHLAEGPEDAVLVFRGDVIALGCLPLPQSHRSIRHVASGT